LEWWPDEVVLLTTSHGDELYRDGDPQRQIAPLLGAKGRLLTLVSALGRPQPGVRCVVARLPSGEPILDIRSEAEVTAFADQLIREVRRATQGDNELHLSLAGGRKTMSYLAGAVISLFGRPQDRLSHILVEPKELEKVPNFWWPGQSEPIDGSDAIAVSAKTRLHSVPFLRLRAYLPDDEPFFGGDLGFEEAVKRANAALAADLLLIDISAMRVSAGGNHVTIREPAQFALYRFLAHLRREGWAIGGSAPGVVLLNAIPFGRRPDGQSLLTLLGEMHEEAWKLGKEVDYLRAAQEREDFVSLQAAGDTDVQPASQLEVKRMFMNRLRPHVSDLRKTLTSAFPPALAKRIAPKPVTIGARRGYWTIDWDPSRIEIR
jgi:CRISPR-associated protein (TIGR02584 family)